MKTLKVYDDVHTSVKVAAAQLGRTTPNIASSLLRHCFGQIERGEIKLDGIPAAEPESEDEEESTEPAAK